MDKAKVIEELYESFPDEDIFDANQSFDNFLVGEGSRKWMDKINPKRGRFLDQLIGVFSLSDLKEKSEEETFEVMVNDLGEFEKEEILVENPEEYFFNIKKRILDKYEFIKEKSKEFAGRPMRERDLIISNNDSYLLKYIENQGWNHQHIIDMLAQLSAYEDIGLKDVVFHSIDDCPLCLAKEGTYYSISDLMSRIGAGQDLTHRGALCRFAPVFRSRSKDEFTISAYIGDIYFKNFPIEFEEFVTDDLLESIGRQFKVHFIDFNKLEDIDPGTVVRVVSDNIIEVHNGYIDRFSPLDFLKEWVKSEKVLVESDKDFKVSEDQEFFYLNGKKVVEKNGNYIDVDTGNIVELSEE
jgi:hypothetical protein